MIQIGDQVWVACVLKTGPAPFQAVVTQKKGAYYKVDGWDMWWRPEALLDSKDDALAMATVRHERLQMFQSKGDDR